MFSIAFLESLWSPTCKTERNQLRGTAIEVCDFDGGGRQYLRSDLRVPRLVPPCHRTGTAQLGATTVGTSEGHHNPYIHNDEEPGTKDKQLSLIGNIIGNTLGFLKNLGAKSSVRAHLQGRKLL